MTGDGQKLLAVAVEYDAPIATAGLSTTAFTVDGRTVTRVYANTAAQTAETGADGNFAIVELSADDDAALLWGGPDSAGSQQSSTGSAASETGQPADGPQLGSSSSPTITAARATVTQALDITTVSGETYPRSAAVTTDRSADPLVDLFDQFTFDDPKTGKSLPYNLFVPRELEAGRRYPLVLFMHDASVVGAEVKGPLVQGLGAVCWASPDDQRRHPCFVVAPQYPTVVVADDYQPTDYFDTTVNLVNDLVARHPVDPAALHATGQSMGAMLTLGMNIKHPDMFASSYVVAGQWPAEQAEPLVGKKLWITVSQGDTKAYPMNNELTTVIEQHGGSVDRATWDARWDQQRFATEVSAVQSGNADVDYVSFLTGTVPVPSRGLQEHNGTWRIAYSIPGIRDWVLSH